MRHFSPPVAAAVSALAVAVTAVGALSCQSSGPVVVEGRTAGPGGTTVTGRGGLNQPAGNDPYGLPTQTPVGGEIVRATPTPLPSDIPPTPVPTP